MKTIKERDVKKSIRNNLPLLVSDIVAVIPIFTGTAKSAYSAAWVHGAEEGTPDLCAIMAARGGHVIFIECKRPNGGIQSIKQKEFQYKVSGLNNIHYVLAKSLADVVAYIQENITGKPVEKISEDYHNGKM